MENTKKKWIIALFIPIIFLVAQSLLSAPKGQSISQSDFLEYDAAGSLVVQIPFSNLKKTPISDVASFKYMTSTLSKGNILTSKVIDIATFNQLYQFPEDRIKVNNDYYLQTDSNSFYFKDKNYVYVFNPEKESFFIAGVTSDYSVLGGAYLRVGNQIYWQGKEVNDADVHTFKTLKLIRPDSEWPATIGLDQNYIFSGANKLRYQDVKDSRLFNFNLKGQELKSLIHKYFPNEK